MLEVFPLELMWRTALAIIPLAMLVAVLCRVVPCRPATRHVLWLGVLTVLLVAPFVPRITSTQMSDLRVQVAAWFSQATESTAFQTTLQAGEHPAPDLKKSDDVPLISAKRSSRQAVSQISPSRSSMRQRDRTSPAFFQSIPDVTHSSPVPREMTDHSAVTKLPSRRMPFENNLVPIGAIDSPPSNSPVERDKVSQTIQGSQLIEWKRRMAVVGDALLNVPPIPLTLWLGGIALLAGLVILRVGFSLRLIKTAQVAPNWIEQDVKEAAKELGLSRVPQVMMTHQRVSPLVWCGFRPRLILPRGLWRQLDAPGRNAVIRHELAHLKRRDHWFAWLDLLIGCLYWWHPVVWWIRRRVREEADNCCDAWVMALMPEGRRAYAVALLETKKYTSGSLLTAPVMGLGMAAGAKRFARRLNMVMTEQMVPRVSLRGVLLATLMVTAGSIVTPMWACPPDEKNQSSAETTPRARIVAASPVMQATTTAPKSDDSTYERFMQERKPTATTQPQTVISTQSSSKSKSCCTNSCCDGTCCRVSSKVIESSNISGGSITIVPGIERSDVVLVADVISYTPRSMPEDSIVAFADDCEDEIVIRAYPLPRGKLEAMIRLMIRDDVPILISPQEDVIEVHATVKHHAVFRSFVNMIHPEGNVASDDKEYDALVSVETAPDWPGRQREIRSQIRECRRNIDRLQRESERCERRRDSLERRAERRLGQMEELLEESAEFEMHILEMEEAADSRENDEDQDRFMVERDELMQQFNELESRAGQYESDAESLFSEIDSLEEQTEILEAEIRMIEAHLETLEEVEIEADWVDEVENTEDWEDEEDN